MCSGGAGESILEAVKLDNYSKGIVLIGLLKTLLVRDGQTYLM